MNAKHISVANDLVRKLSEVRRDRKALTAGPSAAGVRCRNSDATYVTARPDDWPAIVEIINRGFNAEEDLIRARAAAIGLML